MGTRPRPIDSSARVVLDTAVVVSALVFDGGRLAWLRSAWRQELIRPLVSKATASEMLRVLAYPRFGLLLEEQQILQADYLPYCEPVTTTVQEKLIPRCRDPYDRPFLLLALAGSADFLVSGDADLLILASRFDIPIVKPAQLQSLLGFTE